MFFRAVFVRPSNRTGSAYLNKWGFLPAPLGLLALAGEIKRVPESEVKIIDMEGDNLSLDDAVKQILEYNPDLVGITLHATAAHNNAGYIARAVKKAMPDTVLVAGGHHATFLPEELIEAGFDISVLGEGDETIYDIAMAIIENKGFNKINGIVYKDNSGIKRTEPRKLIQDLDTLPMPPLELLDPDKYTFKVFGSHDRVMCLETSRGCPYGCDFCSVTPTWGNTWRNKSNERIVQEMENAKKAGYNWIFFTDDIFIVEPNVKHRDALFNMIIEKNLNTSWIVQMRVDVTSRHPDLIEKAAKAGMSISFLGVESGSEEILKKMHKGEFTPQSAMAVKILSSNGIVVIVGMMIGAPYERYRDLKSTVKFSRELARAGADALQFSIYTPLPGTRIFQEALENNELFTLDWDRFDVLTPVMKTRVGPVLDQIVQFYASYSFYIYKFLRGKILGLQLAGKKKKLIDTGTKFIVDMMPEYLRSMGKFPKHVLETYDMYWNSKKNGFIGKEGHEELVSNSNKIIYDMGKKKNVYYMIKR